MKKSRHGDAAQPKMLLEDSPSHLLHRVLQIALDIYTLEVGDGALTQRQYALLMALDGSEGLSQTDLVRVTGIDRSTLADLVARMIAKGLLARERSATDARANLVYLAEAGRAALDAMHPRVVAADSKILGLLSPPKRDSFVKLLRKITTAREEELVTASVGDAPHKDKAAKKADKKKKGHKKPGAKAESTPTEVTVLTPRKTAPDAAAAKKTSKVTKLGKKLKKLPMPPLSEGAHDTALDPATVEVLAAIKEV